LAERKQIRSLLSTTAKKHSKTIQSLQYVFISDDDLHQINLAFLNHDTLTDIITFDLGTTSTVVDGEIYISLDRVKENSTTMNTLYFEELIRVISHGLLHLIGFKDKTSKDAAIMRSKEEECLSLWRSIQ
jgi:rRNA maturation RNase YbeY